jgi:hypothetical protein
MKMKMLTYEREKGWKNIVKLLFYMMALIQQMYNWNETEV